MAWVTASRGCPWWRGSGLSVLARPDVDHFAGLHCAFHLTQGQIAGVEEHVALGRRVPMPAGRLVGFKLRYGKCKTLGESVIRNGVPFAILDDFARNPPLKPLHACAVLRLWNRRN